MPLMQTVMLTIYPPEKRGSAMGMFGLVIAFAPAIGPTILRLYYRSLYVAIFVLYRFADHCINLDICNHLYEKCHFTASDARGHGFDYFLHVRVGRLIVWLQHSGTNGMGQYFGAHFHWHRSSNLSRIHLEAV